jgi:hypothetical protein
MIFINFLDVFYLLGSFGLYVLVYIIRRFLMIEILTFVLKFVRYTFKIPVSLDVMPCSVVRRKEYLPLI